MIRVPAAAPDLFGSGFQPNRSLQTVERNAAKALSLCRRCFLDEGYPFPRSICGFEFDVWQSIVPVHVTLTTGHRPTPQSVKDPYQTRDPWFHVWQIVGAAALRILLAHVERPSKEVSIDMRSIHDNPSGSDFGYWWITRIPQHGLQEPQVAFGNFDEGATRVWIGLEPVVGENSMHRLPAPRLQLRTPDLPENQEGQPCDLSMRRRLVVFASVKKVAAHHIDRRDRMRPGDGHPMPQRSGTG
jgi:hypothetical protein